MNKSTVMLLALLLVLGAIVLLVLPSEEERMTSDVRPPVSFTVDSAAIVGLTIERPGKTLSIEKVGGIWSIASDENHPADPAAVGQVIGGLSRFKPGSLISDNPTKQGLFQVDSTGSLVTLADRDGNKTSIIIGKMGPSFSEVYFRLPGSSEVYLGSGITTWTLNKESRDWRDKTVFASPAEALTGVKVVSDGKTREFTKDSTGWKSNGKDVPTGTINPILTTLAGLRAEDFIDSAVDFGTRPSTVEVTGDRNATLNFYRLRSDTNKYAVVTSESPQRYIVGKYAASQLFKTVGEPAAVARPSVRTAASKPPAVSTPRKTEPAVTKPAVTPAATRKTEPPPVTREVTKTPVTTGGAPTTPAAVNPFKQHPAGESVPAGETTTPPARKQALPPPSGRTPVGGRTNPPVKTETPAKTGTSTKPLEDEGELTVHVVKKGETMTTIARDYSVTVEQILKWNLLKSISVRPGQELYIFVRK